MATSNAATTYLENKLLSFIFKNNAVSFSTPGDSIYVGQQPLCRRQRQHNSDMVNTSTQDANYARQQVGAAKWTLASSSTDQQTVTNAAMRRVFCLKRRSHLHRNACFHCGRIQLAATFCLSATGYIQTIASGDIFRR